MNFFALLDSQIFPLFSFLKVLGVFIPFSFGLLLCFRKPPRLNRYLGIFLLLFSIHMLLFGFPGLLLIPFPWLLILFTGLPFLYGPLMLFYVYGWLKNENKVPLWVHFIPAILEMLLYLTLFLAKGSDYLITGIERAYQGNPYLFVPLLDGLKTLSGIIYTFLIIQCFRTNSSRLRLWAAFQIHRKWLIYLMTGFAFCWLAVFVLAGYSLVEGYSRNSLELRNQLQLVTFILFSLSIGIFGLSNPVILSPKEARARIRKNLNLNEDDLLRIETKVREQIEAGVLKDEGLSLRIFSEKICISSNALSFFLNDRYQVNYKTFINQQRIKAFIESATPEALKHSTLLGLAMDAGFTSKSTFNRVFKEIMKQTPQEFLKKRSQNS